MYYREEKYFLRRVILEMYQNGITKIPKKSDKIKMFVGFLEESVNEILSSKNPVPEIDAASLIFLKRPIEGVPDEFIDVFEDQGDILCDIEASYNNDYYMLKISPDRFEYICSRYQEGWLSDSIDATTNLFINKIENSELYVIYDDESDIRKKANGSSRSLAK